MVVGNPVDIGKTWMTAVIDAPAFEKIKSYIDHAKETYPKVLVLAGGKCDAKKGWFIEPTVLEVIYCIILVASSISCYYLQVSFTSKVINLFKLILYNL